MVVVHKFLSDFHPIFYMGEALRDGGCGGERVGASKCQARLSVIFMLDFFVLPVRRCRLFLRRF